jgi:AraC family transcriptional regulator, regulatory protein of adaptative response / methylphosphotriester-DNA alkyltransferase methyltransferase
LVLTATWDSSMPDRVTNWRNFDAASLVEPPVTARDTTVERREQLYRDALRVICADYASPLTVDEVARRIATSRRQLQRVIGEVGGTTFGRLLARARMTAAERLLHDRALPVQEVAQQVGYRQPAQFAKSFRVRYGSSPRDYRLRLNGNAQQESSVHR